jgi:hypothetical protein
MLSKTINASCIFNNTKFLSSCGVSLATGDWTASSQLFAQGFLSDDPLEGGCPPVAINAANPNGNSRIMTKRMEKLLEKMNTDLVTPRMALQRLNKLFAQ